MAAGRYPFVSVSLCNHDTHRECHQGAGNGALGCAVE